MDSIKKTAAIIQARMGSNRLPGKSMKQISGKNILEHVIHRCKLARKLDEVCVATSSKDSDDIIFNFCQSNNIPVFRGSENDVLSRMQQTAEFFQINTIVRITADNPLVDPEVIDFMIEKHFNNKAHLTSGYHCKLFPNGTVISVIDLSVLTYLKKNIFDPDVREHVITDIDKLKEKFRIHIPKVPAKWCRYDLRYCLDTVSDFELLDKIISHFSESGIEPTTEDIIQYLDTHDEVRALNYSDAISGY